LNLHEAFLKALADNEDDLTTRLVYADWLDEHGEHEEADRQRKWPAAKEWLVRFCQRNNPPDDLDPDERFIPYAELIELTSEAVVQWQAIQPDDRSPNDRLRFHCGNNAKMCDALLANREEFWKNWCIVTGLRLPPDAQENSSFSCAC
jgi:uncharacterized protein (TIGR02996 family)